VKTDLLLMPMGARYTEMRAAAVAAEEAGFDGVWTWDHLRDPDGGAASFVPEAWTMLAGLAEAT
jgi:alkanesulfonate monooxygenase SsuD/methylene tetrahydromethanopterin reductase-like flavin-dependent oxidoreductase (luciferase family)